MANFIISPYAISFNNIKDALQKYINDKNVSSVIDTWSDFYTSGAGQTIIELDSALGTFYAFHFIMGRREAYLPVAQNYSSILGGAESLGYCASRGHNVHIKLKIIPNNTQTLAKWTTIGTYAEYDIVLLEQVTLTKDKEIEIPCVLGNSSLQAITITSSELQQFTFTADDTTDDYRLILNDTEVPIGTNLEEAMEDKYIVLSNSYGSVDVFYLNQGGNHTNYSVVRGADYAWTYTKGEAGEPVPQSALLYDDVVQTHSIVNTGDFTYTGSTLVSNYTYSTQDVLYLQYIQRNNLQYSGLSLSTFVVDYGEVSDFSLIEDRRSAQDSDSIKLAASLAHETNNVVRARKDYAKFLLQDNTLNLIDTNDHDINPGLMAVTYLKKPNAEGNTLLSVEEKEAYMEKVVRACPDGVANIYIEDPIPVVRTLDIELKQKSNDVIPADINDQIDEILDSYRNKLHPTLDLEALENSLEQISGVKIARVDIGTQDYQLDTAYKLYDVVTVENVLVGTEFQTWTMVAIKIQSKSGENEPDWGSAGSYGDTVVDSDLLWERANKYVSSIPFRWKSRGDFNLYSDVAVGYDIYPNSTSYTMPNWDNTFVVDGNVTFNKLKTYDYALSYWAANTEYNQNEYVIFSREDERAVYKVTDLLSNSGKETPKWEEAKELNDIVEDNAIVWRLEYKGYNAQSDYAIGDEVAIEKDNKIYIYSANIYITKDTKYANTQKTGAEQSPFDGSEEIKEWVVDTAVALISEEPIAELAYKEGGVAWSLIDTIDTYSNWTATTSYELETYTFANNNVFKVFKNDIHQTGDDWFSALDDWPSTYTDNNVVWEKDTFYLGDDEISVEGTTWLANTEYKLNDLIIVNGSAYTYIYNVVHLNNVANTNNNIVFTVTNFTGVTGNSEPQWTYTKVVNGEEVTVPYDNVYDNTILWTKTTNASDNEWKAETRMDFGTIINTPGGYYVFSSLVGKSGTESPNWAGINGGVVVDNNITWQKVEKNTVIQLAWNEYLDLKYELQPIT